MKSNVFFGMILVVLSVAQKASATVMAEIEPGPRRIQITATCAKDIPTSWKPGRPSAAFFTQGNHRSHFQSLDRGFERVDAADLPIASSHVGFDVYRLEMDLDIPSSANRFVLYTRHYDLFGHSGFCTYRVVLPLAFNENGDMSRYYDSAMDSRAVSTFIVVDSDLDSRP